MTSRAIAACILVVAAATNGRVIAESAPPPSPPAEARLQRSDLLDHLGRTRNEFLAAISEVTEGQWKFKPAPDRWSIAECAEHVTRAESFIREAAREALAAPSAGELLGKSHGKEPEVLALLAARSRTFNSPEPIDPGKGGTVRGREDLERAFSYQRGRTFELAATSDGLWTHSKKHPAFDELDVAGWLLFLSAHTERHVAQILEVKRAPGYPPAR